MFLAEVDISKTAYLMMTQKFSQVVMKFIPCDDVTQGCQVAVATATLLKCGRIKS